jgi:hypothetical protein
MRGAPAKVIQELAGHTRLTTTMRYMHLAEGHKEQAIRLLDRRAAVSSAPEAGRALAAQGPGTTRKQGQHASTREGTPDRGAERPNGNLTATGHAVARCASKARPGRCGP